MWKVLVSILALVALMLALGMGASAQPETAPATTTASGQAKLRVGTYDNRVIAIAWFNSEFNDLSSLHKEHEQAKKDGDKKRMKELEELGPKLQRKLHFQGFGRAPVTDLLEPVQDELAALATELNLDLIAFDCNYSSDEVELIDISFELAKLYKPTPKVMKQLREIEKHDPVPLEDLKDDH